MSRRLRRYDALTPPVKAQRGFTLVELMVVVTIVSVVLLLAVPGFSELTLSTRLRGYANEMVSSINMARSEAINRNGRWKVCISTNGTDCAGSGDWEQGWIVTDPNENVVISSHSQLPDGFKFIADDGSDELVFSPTGLRFPAGGGITELVVCQLTPEVGSHERVVEVSATGRPTAERRQDNSCP